MIRKLVRYAKGYGWRAIGAGVTIAIEVLLEVFIPFVMRDVINEGLLGDGGVELIVEKGLIMIGLALLSLCFGALSARLSVVASAGFAKNLRQALFYKIQDFSFANVDKFSTASLITRSTTDVTNLQQAFMMGTRMLVRSPVMLVAATLMALQISSGMGVIFAFGLPVLMASMIIIVSIAFPRFKRMFTQYDKMNARIQENLIAMRVVKAFVREDYERETYNATAGGLRDASVSAEKVVILNGPVANFTLYACMIATCYIGGRNILVGDMLPGDLMSFISYIAQILSSVMMITMIFVSLVMSRASATRVVEVLDERVDIVDSGADPELKVADGSIVFENVSFSYSKSGENLTLRNINLSISSGETIGIIGGTGSAKTTLVQLIPRLYDVYEGAVKVGGRDVREYTLDNLRASVSMVLQKNVLFSGTIADNLRWGDINATDGELKDVCESAQADSFIESFPDGYDTELGQGGVNVSGGQKQRLCIARALLKRPKILILDDSTSAVDTATDAKIREAFASKHEDTTMLIIAQRISSVSDADRIIVMHDGEIDAVGTHDELLATNEIYQQVYFSQQKGVA
ncbi:MAG: ABC transporter ATP-binding protein [Clostridia bacterium]|nr:ABC transporter ATP-binding protein [Clostridia bacterium]